MRDTSKHSDLVGAVKFILNPDKTIEDILNNKTPPSDFLQGLITLALCDDWPARKTFKDYGDLYEKIQSRPQDDEISRLMKTLKTTVFPAAKLRIPKKLKGLLQNNTVELSLGICSAILKEFMKKAPFGIKSIELISNETILMLKELLCWASRLVASGAIKEILEKDSDHLTTKIIDYKESKPSFFKPSLTNTRKLLQKRSLGIPPLECVNPDGNIAMSMKKAESTRILKNRTASPTTPTSP